jgi:hypothetical protein
MKMIAALISSLLLTTASFAGNTDDLCTRSVYPSEIGQLMKEQAPFYQEDLSGKVTIRFTVDDQKTIHILDIHSANIYLKSHTLDALEGKELRSECLPGDETYEITIDFNYVI